MSSPTNPRDPRLIRQMAHDPEVVALSQQFFNKTIQYRYSYNFTWLGVPVIQYPQDLLALQELIWRVKPRLIVETGVAYGGATLFYASLLELLGGDGQVVGIDIEIRSHNRRAIEAHPLSRRVRLIEGSSIDPQVVAQVKALAARAQPVLVILDSNHTCAHVRQELEGYAPLVKEGSYLVVLDTVIEDLSPELIGPRPWGPGNSPRTAVQEFLGNTDRFVVDDEMENSLLLTVAPGGYLKCVKSAA
jgi:cephalosporin hydroxylase